MVGAVQVEERQGYGEEEGKLDFGDEEEGAQHGQDPHFLAVFARVRVHRVSRMPLSWTKKWSGLCSMRGDVRTARGPEAVSSPEALSWV